MTSLSEDALLKAQATIRLLQDELAATNREVLLLTLELERRVEERTTQLTEANRELEAFSYSVSHDLRAPLRHICGFADLLQGHASAQLDDEGRELLRRITASAGRMTELIEGILRFSRASRVEVEKREIDLQRMISEVIAGLEAETQGREIVWEIAELPKVWAEPLSLRQVLVNVIANAVKYTRPRGPARIVIRREASATHEVVWSIRDNGVGFDMQYADRLFGVFQRLHNDADFEGIGIGLATAQRIMARHGGRIWAEAQPDQGACFYLALPAAV